MGIKSSELYKILRDKLMSAEHAEGKALPSLRELETQYGIGKDTINKVLATLEGEGLIARDGFRRYPVFRHRSEDRVIALEHIFRTNEHPFFGPLNCGIVDTFLANEYGVQLFTHRDDGSVASGLSHGAVMSNLLERGVLRGVVFPFSTPRLEDVAMLSSQGVAVCTMNVVPGPGVIWIDMRQAALQGTHHLMKLGRNHIGIVDARSLTSGTAFEGYREALALNERPYCEDDVIDCSAFVEDKVSNKQIPSDIFRREILQPIIEGARQAVLQRLQAGSFPRGLYITDEYLAIGVVRALEEAGLRVPEDVALVSHMSFGNTAMELAGLTTTEFDGYGCGMDAARFMIDIAEGRRPADDRMALQTRLVKGTSCGELDRLGEDITSVTT